MAKTRNRLIAFGIALLALIAAALFIIPQKTASAAGWDGTTVANSFAGGDGSEESPYKISSGAELAYLAQQVNDNAKTYEGKNFQLTADIDLGGKEWTPIGTSYFEGIFDGGGHKIHNFTINSDRQKVGLFGINYGTIKDLAVEGNVSGKIYVGGICGYNRGTIEGCSFKGEVSGTSERVGGISGSNAKSGIYNGKVERCAADGTVSGNDNVGGICGDNNGGTIKNCFNSSDVMGNDYVGGIIGASASPSSEASYCISIGDVSGSGKDVGGICGHAINAEKINTNVNHCYYDGNACDAARPIGNNTDNVSIDNSNYVYKVTKISELCSDYFLKFSDDRKFDNTIWQAGDSSVTADSENERFGTMQTKYIKLKGVGEEKYANDGVSVYNFSTYDEKKWQEYTLIKDEAQFIAIGNDSASWGKNFVLARDLNLSGKEIKPIGYTIDNSATPFTGKFSGDGYTIKNVKMSADKGTDGFGLFGKNKGKIMFLSVEGDITCTETNKSVNIGGICGYNVGGGEIYGCSFEGTLRNEGNSSAGGICGNNYGEIVYCYAFADVYSNYHAGGICGQENGSYSLNSCYFVGNVTGGTKDKTGAITGNNSQQTSYCYYDKERCNASDERSKITGKTTQELCEMTNIAGFTDKLWTAGSFSATADGYFRTAKYTYPKLKYLKKAAKSGTVKQYNFKTDGADDWQEYTLIKNQSDLEKIAENLGGNYVLGADIKLSSGFKAICTAPNAFTGKLSGDGYTISGDVSYNGWGGLFNINRGSIMYLNVKGNIHGQMYTGTICGNNQGLIYGCSFEGTVNAGSEVGGICGMNATSLDGSTSGAIKNCYVIGSITATNGGNAGGICGSGNPDSKIESCYFVGKTAVPTGCTVSPICSGGTFSNCYYNLDIYKTLINLPNGVNRLQTFHMTGSDALKNMGLSDEIWEKKPNDKENGKAYYPSLKRSKGEAPFEKYEAKLSLVPQISGGKYPDYGDNIKFNIYLETEFGNGIASFCMGEPKFTIKISDKTVVDSGKITFDSNNSCYTATYKADTAGEITFTLVCEISDAYLPDKMEVTNKLTIKKKTLTESDFNADLPSNPTYDGNVKEAKVTANSGITGYGEITVKYFDSNTKKQVEKPINAGTYDVKIDVSEGEGYNAATNLGNWSFTIGQKTANISNINVTYGVKKTGVCTVPVEGIPEDLGTSQAPLFAYEDSKNIINQNSVKFSGGKLTFSFNKLSDANIGDTAKITTTITSQNYADITFTVNVTLNGLKDPTVPKCELTIVHGENGVLTATITAVEGAEYKFNNGDWLETNSHAGIEHGEKVTASVRIAAVDGKNNASEAAVAVKYATDGCKFTSDANGHTLTCTKCDYKGNQEPHTFSGNSCAVCGYKKSGSSGGGSHSGGSSGGGSYSPTNPAVDGKEMSWSDVKNEISKLGEGAEATLDLNGNTTVPKDVIKAIAEKNAVVTIKVNGTFSWTIDGSKLTESDIKGIDFDVDVVTVSGTETLRGTVGTGFKIGEITEKAQLNIRFRAAQSGKFANLYKKDGEKLTFIDNVKIDENGNASGLEVHEKGEYAVMLGEFSDRQGDMNNDGVMNAKDALAVLKHSAKLEAGKNTAVADLNGDGIINAKDALIILKKAAGLM